jgi:hypothetical protein
VANPVPVTYSSPVSKVGGGREIFPNASLDLLASIPDGQWVKANMNAYSSVWPPADLRPVYGGGKHNPREGERKGWLGYDGITDAQDHGAPGVWTPWKLVAASWLFALGVTLCRVKRVVSVDMLRWRNG